MDQEVVVEQDVATEQVAAEQKQDVPVEQVHVEQVIHAEVPGVNIVPQPLDAGDDPITSLSLLQLTSYLLWARQRGHITKTTDDVPWEIHLLQTHDYRTQSYAVSFDKSVLAGMRLIRVPSDNEDRKLSIFGYQREEKYQWIGSSEYSLHLCVC